MEPDDADGFKPDVAGGTTECVLLRVLIMGDAILIQIWSAPISCDPIKIYILSELVLTLLLQIVLLAMHSLKKGGISLRKMVLVWEKWYQSAPWSH